MSNFGKIYELFKEICPFNGRSPGLIGHRVGQNSKNTESKGYALKHWLWCYQNIVEIPLLLYAVLCVPCTQIAITHYFRIQQVL